jgi:hypothetical protein
MIAAKHGIVDYEKYESLLDVFDASGSTWPDAVPGVLTVGNDAITGSHRIAAAKATETPVKYIDLTEEGVDFEELGYSLEELLLVDDYDIADMLREAGREDLAQLALP